MSQSTKANINSHIESYLDYYCQLSHAPQFAVLLQGQWGSGKTWFIEEYQKRNKEKCKFLYVSLYGMTSFSEIEESFFRQLHPILSSKGMTIAGKVIKGFLKGALKIDLNDDGQSDGTWSIQIPDIDLPNYLKDADESILIFDDLERCKIDLDGILGYINYFVEHQEFKVIILANESELLKIESYKSIKEKLIGKTFDISLDFTGALESFIKMVDHSEVESFLNSQTDLIRNIYETAEYDNLRSLKQVVFDFKRIYDQVPEKIKLKPEILQEILRLLMVISIAIKLGQVFPKDIARFKEEYMYRLQKKISNQSPNMPKEGHDKNENVMDRCSGFIDFFDPFPSFYWWETFFSKGIVDSEELSQSIEYGKYFKDEKTPNWVKLWHYTDLEDEEFEEIISQVDSEFNKREFSRIEVLKHVVGLFLKFSDVNLYLKDRNIILQDARDYIDFLEKHKPEVIKEYVGETFASGYMSLGYQEAESNELKEFQKYILQTKQKIHDQELPTVSRKLLDVMSKDVLEFSEMICLSQHSVYATHKEEISKYYEDPVLMHIAPEEFLKSVLSIKMKDWTVVFGAISKRYKYSPNPQKLTKEIDWLKEIKAAIIREANLRENKLSGYVLKQLNEYYINKAITELDNLSGTENN